jgi:hypothetical protein
MQRLNPVTCQGHGRKCPGRSGTVAPARITGVSVQLNHLLEIITRPYGSGD